MTSLVPPGFWPAVHFWTTGDRWPPSNAQYARAFIESCTRHRLLALLHAESDLPEILAPLRDSLHGFIRTLTARALLLGDAARRISSLLGEESFVFLKGVDYSWRLYPERRFRFMDDVDVLVAPARFQAVSQRLIAAGMVAVLPFKKSSQDPAHHERTFLLDGIPIDLHQAFVQNSRNRIDYEDLLSRRVAFTMGGIQAFRLEDVDALTYHVLSMAIDEFHVTIDRYLDLWHLLRQRKDVASAAAERARDWQVVRALYCALRQACRLFPAFTCLGTDRVADQLLPRRTQIFLDRWVLPSRVALQRRTNLRRSAKLWRKFWLMDSYARRLAFARSHASSVLRTLPFN